MSPLLIPWPNKCIEYIYLFIFSPWSPRDICHFVFFGVSRLFQPYLTLKLLEMEKRKLKIRQNLLFNQYKNMVKKKYDDEKKKKT